MDWCFIILVPGICAVLTGLLLGLLVGSIFSSERQGVCFGILVMLIAAGGYGYWAWSHEKSALNERQADQRAEAEALQGANEQFAERMAELTGDGLLLVPLSGGDTYLSVQTGEFCGDADQSPCVMLSWQQPPAPAQYLTVPMSRFRVVQDPNVEHPRAQLTFRELTREIQQVNIDLQAVVNDWLDQATVTCQPGQCLLQMGN